MQTATPMIKQYQRIKAQHQDCILFFRLGDFYEMFYEDAKVASKILDLVLTSRGKGTEHHIPMCGVPFHAAQNYIAKLIKAGHKVAICEQTEDPAQAQGIVKRDVIRIITTGTFLDEQSADARYLLCLCANGKNIGMAFMDPADGTIRTNQFSDPHRILEIMARLPVYECIYAAGEEEKIKSLLHHPLLCAKNIALSSHEDWCFNYDIARKALCEHFNVHNLKGFGIDDLKAATASAGALLEYLRAMNKQPLEHIDRITLYTDEKYVYISPAANYGLELDTLFRSIDATTTAMGKRKLRYWLYHPLKQPAAILQRQAAVTLLKGNQDIHKQLRQLISPISDIEKSISKLSCGYTHAKDILGIRNALALIPDLQKAINPLEAKNRLFHIDDIPDLRRLLAKAVDPQMPLSNPEGKMINPGFHADLDALRDIQANGRQWLKNFQAEEIKKTRINSLKVGFNKVFGYYIEVTKANLKAVPDYFIRKQTLVNAERFITPELKEYEEKILNAQEKILKIEHEIVMHLREEILKASSPLHEFCQRLAVLDVLANLCLVAQWPNYIAPEITDQDTIDIRDGRHPFVEQNLKESFIPNDTCLDGRDNHLLILTGPNMAGKSTYIRQIALLVILAQMGSYIPASKASIGVVDKIFTRIGAHDDLIKGQSTFMVEMNEMADILNNLTDRSLIILDEIGRGTSTFDGLSLAWALAEHLQKTTTRTLFATHFHELTALSDEQSGVKNYNVAVKEWKDEVIFLHKIVPGSTDDSYGIYVAKLAGIPKNIINRSKRILTQLEMQSNLKEKLVSGPEGDKQMSFFSNATDPSLAQIKKIIQAMDVNSLTPIEALNKIQQMKDLINE